MMYSRQLKIAFVSFIFLSSRAATFTVINTNDSGAGSLRDAITSSNTTAGTNTINFNIPGSAPFTITPVTALPNISTNPVTIDATTQPGYTDTPVVILAGNLSLPVGLNITTNNVTIRGLNINNFQIGINAASVDSLLIEKNIIDHNGDASASLAAGIIFQNVTNAAIQDNTISNNGFGTPAPNPNGGIASIGGSDIQINNNIVDSNGTATDLSNGGPQGGIIIAGTLRLSVTNNTVTNNATGSAPGGQLLQGGIAILSGDTLFVANNTISSNASGIVAQPTAQGGIVALQAARLTITQNTVSGNANTSSDGFVLHSGILVLASNGSLVTQNTVSNNGNGDGTDYHAGIFISGLPEPLAPFGGSYNAQVTNNTVYSNGLGSGAGSYGGILLSFANNSFVYNNTVFDNSFGSGGNRAGVLLNGAMTIPVLSSFTRLLSSPFMLASGTLMPVSTIGNKILSNSIFNNQTLGIELVNGANNQQVAPVLTSAVATEGIITITGTMSSDSPQTFILQFFSNLANDPEGRTLIGEENIGVNGTTPFRVTFEANLLQGTLITATATRQSTGDTSQFSNGILIPSGRRSLISQAIHDKYCPQVLDL